MNRSTPGLPVHHQLPEFTQTHGHRVSDAIQPSHPLLSPSPYALGLLGLLVLYMSAPPGSSRTFDCFAMPDCGIQDSVGQLKTPHLAIAILPI